MVGKLGRRQIKILNDMVNYGDGTWPSSWHLTYTQKASLAALEDRGLVRTDGMGWRILEDH